ncbi:glycosyltransferase family 39 protein [Caldicellulosiruptor morganii]|uniref:Polyprenol-phosphate-mannose--protein mannosyltransferase n=1 Tax=Caldicellulosiruptor morganii TaxID=1387555 RepID=A0ABY7BMM0_9FIRM|nr:glycosyltransferase family 39 protein [Caldicellulosiruptor morganii]WAM33658.1 glycosyltransferase family 39 protein [Caldicellulosiruptor morganii]
MKDKKIIAATILVMVAYFLVQISTIGARNIPETYWKPLDVATISIDLGKKPYVKEFLVYFGYGEGKIDCQFYRDNSLVLQQSLQPTFFQAKNVILNAEVDKVILITNGVFEIREIAIKDEKGRVINLEDSNISLISGTKYEGELRNLVDEQSKMSQVTNYKFSSYFDEIYHARTAYEFAKGLPPYDLVHPPLGKWLISVGICIFGGNPFGWRIINLLGGTLLIGFLILLVSKHFKFSTIESFTLLVLIATDFMHFTLSRIANLDTFSLLFDILTAIFAMNYINLICEQKNENSNTTLNYYLTFTFAGMAFACKWNAIFPLIPLLVGVVFAFILTCYKTKAKLSKIAKRLVLSAVGFIVPYYLTYLPIIIKYPYYGLPKGLVGDFVMLQNHIWKYHSTLNATHPFSSEWYQWLLSTKPLWAYFDVSLPSNLKSTIAMLGNPVMWGVGLLSIALLTIMTVTSKEKEWKSWAVILCYIFSIVPWMFIGRIRFIYHYYLAIPWLYIAIIMVLKKIKAAEKVKNKILIGLNILTIIMFVLYYPVISGVTVSTKYIDMLKIMKSWIF